MRMVDKVKRYLFKVLENIGGKADFYLGEDLKYRSLVQIDNEQYIVTRTISQKWVWLLPWFKITKVVAYQVECWNRKKKKSFFTGNLPFDNPTPEEVTYHAFKPRKEHLAY